MEKTYPMAMVTAPRKIEFRERRLPELGPKDVLLGVKAASICGSDLHIFKGKHPSAPLPVAIGHELSGVVLKMGSEVSKLKEGDRVVVEPVIVCGNCTFCRRGEYHLCSQISFQYRAGQGAFSPYFVVHEDWAHRLPEKTPFEEGALVEPLAVAIHAVKKAGIELGHTVAIFGAGAIGLLILLLARHAGAGELLVADVREFRLIKAKELGANEGMNNAREDVLQSILEKTSRLGVDRAFEAAGLETTLIQALKALKKGGTAIVAGIFESPEVTLPANLFIQKEISLVGTQGYCWDFQTALKLLEQGRIPLKTLITHVLPFSSLQEGFELLTDPVNTAIKVVVCMD